MRPPWSQLPARAVSTCLRPPTLRHRQGLPRLKQGGALWGCGATRGTLARADSEHQRAADLHTPQQACEASSPCEGGEGAPQQPKVSPADGCCMHQRALACTAAPARAPGHTARHRSVGDGGIEGMFLHVPGVLGGAGRPRGQRRKGKRARQETCARAGGRSPPRPAVAPCRVFASHAAQDGAMWSVAALRGAMSGRGWRRSRAARRNAAQRRDATGAHPHSPHARRTPRAARARTLRPRRGRRPRLRSARRRARMRSRSRSASSAAPASASCSAAGRRGHAAGQARSADGGAVPPAPAPAPAPARTHPQGGPGARGCRWRLRYYAINKVRGTERGQLSLVQAGEMCVALSLSVASAAAG